MVIVDCFDKWLDFATLRLSSFRHTACDGGRVALDSGDQSVGKGVRFRTGIEGLNDNDLSKIPFSLELKTVP